MAPLAAALSAFVFLEVPIAGVGVPAVVIWLVAAGVFFTFRLGFVNVRGFGHGLALLGGRLSSSRGGGAHGEVSHFQALATAISGTVGIGNIGGVAVAITLGGPGAAFWLFTAGALGMATKFAECTLGVRYRREQPDGTISGGPMYYLQQGLAERGLPRLGRVLGTGYAAGLVVGCLGIGNMFQANQAFVQFVVVTGGEASWFADRGWLCGLVLAGLVWSVTVGGIRTIARVTRVLVPFMALLYLATAAVVLATNVSVLPLALARIVGDAFATDAVAGGALGALVIGFQRAVFSNEAGIGSASIAHSAVRTDHPAAEGHVALLEPFIDTMVICMATALVIVTTDLLAPDFAAGLDGIAMTSAAFARVVPFFPPLLAAAALLFAFSTMLAWSYYGLKGWTFLVGERRRAERGFQLVFCAFVVLGATIELASVLAFSDAMVFLICIPNIVGLYLLAPRVREEIARYAAWRTGEIPEERG